MPLHGLAETIKNVSEFFRLHWPGDFTDVAFLMSSIEFKQKCYYHRFSPLKTCKRSTHY